MKHTPGPWKVYSRGKTRAQHIEFEKSFWVGFGETKCRGPGTIVDMIHPVQGLLAADLIEKNEVEARANANLIASAPCMLEALEAAKKYLESELQEPGRTVFWKLVGAIKKAKGEQ